MALGANAAAALSLLQAHGASKAGAAALVGNWQQESGVNPAEAGGGLAQWQGARATGLQQFAASTGQHPLALPTQVGYAVHELQTQYPGLWKGLTARGANDPGRLALAVSQQYERPGDPMNGNRVAYARAAYSMTGSNTAPRFGPTRVPGATPVASAAQVPRVSAKAIPVPQVNPALIGQVQRGRMVEQLLSRSGGNLPNANLLLGAVQGQVQDAQKQISATRQQQALAKTQNQANSRADTGPLIPTKTAAHGLNAHRDLQELAGSATVVYHGSTGAGTSGTAGNKLSEMVKFAQSAVGKPYVWGGGHGGWGTQPGYDCSGFVSAVLHAAGYLQAPQTTQTLPSQGDIASGPGRFVTVYDRTDGGTPSNDHVIVNLNGAWYEAGGNAQFNSSGGVSRISKPPQSYLDSFNRTLHPLGL